MEPSAIELVGSRSTREEIRGAHNNVYKLWRSSGKSPYDVETQEMVYQEILDSIKECLQCRLDCAQPEEEPRQSSTSTSRPDLQAEFQDRDCATYDHFRDLKEGSCEEALAVAGDAH